VGSIFSLDAGTSDTVRTRSAWIWFVAGRPQNVSVNVVRIFSTASSIVKPNDSGGNGNENKQLTPRIKALENLLRPDRQKPLARGHAATVCQQIFVIAWDATTRFVIRLGRLHVIAVTSVARPCDECSIVSVSGYAATQMRVASNGDWNTHTHDRGALPSRIRRPCESVEILPTSLLPVVTHSSSCEVRLVCDGLPGA
jgi:hypothetical protein